MNVPPKHSSEEKLKQIIQNYQLFAMNTLGGPALLNAELAKLAAVARFNENFVYNAALESLRPTSDVPFEFKRPTQLPVHPNPILMRPDSKCQPGKTVFEGEMIPYFEIGGEKRLCLPEIFKTVLSRFSLDRINQACDTLCIYISRCNSEQLELLKRSGILPETASTCGLITRTDAERLCADLLHSPNDSEDDYVFEKRKDVPISESRIPVYHECFGEGAGFLNPYLYYSPDAKCIECADCGRFFSTKRFVGHSHRNAENRVCHWGFNRNKWRCYLLLDEQSITSEAQCAQLEEVFHKTLNRFDAETRSVDSPRKRKRSSSPQCAEEEETKFRRYSDSHLATGSPRLPRDLWMLTSPSMTFHAHGGVWSAAPTVLPHSREAASPEGSVKARLTTQRSCPPTLEDPARVISSCESNRYEEHFVPNIALQQSNCARSDDSQSDEKFRVHSEQGQAMMDTKQNEQLKEQGMKQLKDTLNPLTAVLSSLASMEHQYLNLLRSADLSKSDKNRLEKSYISHSDTIRRQFSPKELLHSFDDNNNNSVTIKEEIVDL